MSHLFGHLATQFSHSPEDLATEGLRYLLNHRVAGEAFVEFVNARSGADLPRSLTFRTQEGTEEGEGQPDVKGVAGDGMTPLLLESKFWAGLTNNQPNGYLRELAETPGGVLLFLVPHPRQEYLWPRIRNEAASEFEVRPNDESDSSFVLHFSDDTTLTLASWRDALNAVESAVQAEGGMRELLEDIHQVQSLCERYSDTGFHPLRGDEIGPDIGKRLVQLHGIVRDLRNRLGDPSWGSDPSMSTSRKRYAFNTTLYDFDATVGLLYVWWDRDGSSPVWLRLDTQTPGQRDAVRRALKPNFQTREGDARPNSVLICLPLKLGVERDEVLDDLANQLSTIASRLRPVLTDAP